MLFLRALFVLLVYDILVYFCRFPTVYGLAKRWKVAPKQMAQGSTEKVCKAINYATVWYPKETLCLQRAFVTTYLLRKEGVMAHIVLGARKLPFSAHAWVEVEGRAINERSNVQDKYGVWDIC
jgi:hypothetical protein